MNELNKNLVFIINICWAYVFVYTQVLDYFEITSGFWVFLSLYFGGSLIGCLVTETLIALLSEEPYDDDEVGHWYLGIGLCLVLSLIGAIWGFDLSWVSLNSLTTYALLVITLVTEYCLLSDKMVKLSKLRRTLSMNTNKLGYSIPCIIAVNWGYTGVYTLGTTGLGIDGFLLIPLSLASCAGAMFTGFIFGVFGMGIVDTLTKGLASTDDSDDIIGNQLDIIGFSSLITPFCWGFFGNEAINPWLSLDNFYIGLGLSLIICTLCVYLVRDNPNNETKKSKKSKELKGNKMTKYDYTMKFIYVSIVDTLLIMASLFILDSWFKAMTELIGSDIPIYFKGGVAVAVTMFTIGIMISVIRAMYSVVLSLFSKENQGVEDVTNSVVSCGAFIAAGVVISLMYLNWDPVDQGNQDNQVIKTNQVEGNNMGTLTSLSLILGAFISGYIIRGAKSSKSSKLNAPPMVADLEKRLNVLEAIVNDND